MDATRRQLEALAAQPLPADLWKAAKRFARTLARAAGQATGWPSVLFNLWLLIARITRTNADALDDARGLAVLRWKRRATEEWNGPLHWRIHGVPRHSGKNSIFPIA